MLTNFLKNWIADIVIDVAKGLGLTKDNVKMQANDKVFEATITFNNGTEYVYYISAAEDRRGQVVFIDRIDGKGATKECRTKSQMIDFLTNDINTGLVAEATEILEQQGYRVVLNESTQIDEAINNPGEPASKKQLWALFCITKQDWRDKGLTKGEASELIQKYSNNSERHQKALATAKSKQSLESKIGEDIMTNLKPKLDKQMAKAFGMQSVVGDADLEGNLIPGGKRYKFFGSGCGWAWVKYDKRNKKLGEILDKYDDIYRHGYFEKFANEYIKKFKEREMGAVLSQDIDIQCIIKQAALDFAESIGINVKGAYVNSRLD